jgi:TM2 domain-containing membrane protein YozV
VDGGISLTGLGFGVFYPDSTGTGFQYYKNLDFTGVSTVAYISPSMLGLGLPDYLWNQVVNLLYQANTIDLNSLGMKCY